jgi:cation diffusion facilitator CzcD-associated flavoprotein CzcO
VFQRTPAYVLPHDNRPVTARERRLYERLPLAQRAARITTYWKREALAIGFLMRPDLLARAEGLWRRHLRGTARRGSRLERPAAAQAARHHLGLGLLELVSR